MYLITQVTVLLFCLPIFDTFSYVDFVKIRYRNEDDYVTNMRRFLKVLSVKCQVAATLSRQFLESQVKFSDFHVLLYKSNTFQWFKIYGEEEIFFRDPAFDMRKETIIYIPGYNTDPDDQQSYILATNYSIDGRHNFVTFDYSKYSKWNYLRAAILTPLFGEILTHFMSTLYYGGLPVEKIHLIGYSVGAHIAGCAAKTFFRKHKRKVGRVTGLDPTSICFSEDRQHAMSAGDAIFVDVIHTSILSLADYVIGDVDYYVSGRGGIQESCGRTDIATYLGCTHRKGLFIFVESLRNKNGFIARKCPNLHVSKATCNLNSFSNFGQYTNYATRGIYFFTTNDKSPYALGYDGVK